MNTNTGIIIGIIVLVAVGGGIFASMNSNDDAMMAEEKLEQQVMEDTKMAQDTVMRENKVMEEKDAMMKAGSMMKNDETSMMDKGDTTMKAGSYEAYAPEKFARAETGDVVLFFHASWCPSCRALNSSIESNLTSIPEGVTILKTDYDKETELKKKYGVTYQHTLVQVDTSGNMIKKWSGGGTLDTILSQIQ